MMKKKYNPDSAVLDDEEQLHEKHFDDVPGITKERGFSNSSHS